MDGSDSMKPSLELNDISYSYHTLDGETHALSNISFSLSPGEFTAVVGPSGCGKSTLLSLIAEKAEFFGERFGRTPLSLDGKRDRISAQSAQNIRRLFRKRSALGKFPYFRFAESGKPFDVLRDRFPIKTFFEFSDDDKIDFDHFASPAMNTLPHITTQRMSPAAAPRKNIFQPFIPFPPRLFLSKKMR